MAVWFALGGAAEDEPMPQAAAETPRLAGSGSDREEAVRLLALARQACVGVRDYRCTLATRERMRDRLGPEQVAEMAVRVRPFAVRLRWREPAVSVGQQVWFAAGFHNDLMRVRPAGYLGSLVGVMAMDPHAPAVRESSRHAITDAGLGNMLEEFATAWAAEASHETEVRVTGSEVDGKTCWRIVVVLDGESGAWWRRAALHVEEGSYLPVRAEYHDGLGRLLDKATYRDLEVNVGLGDDVFAP
jgi:hypothetical protein